MAANGRTRLERVKAWIDNPTPVTWGVEVNDPSITLDGHYICHTGVGEGGRLRAEIIADALNGRRTPKRVPILGDAK